MKNTAKTTDAASGISRSGFTLPEILIILAVTGLLAALAIGGFSNARVSAQRAKCDARLKALTVALDTFRVETGRYPELLSQLTKKQYLQDVDALRCPVDSRDKGSYQEYYAIRSARDRAELPVIVCPLHEERGGSGAQAYKGGYTKQFPAEPSQLVQVVGTTVRRPGKEPIAGAVGMKLYGGDRIRTNNSGSATILFADGSKSELRGGSSVTVLQSFRDGQTNGSLYTLVRQTLGEVTHRVTHGSKFDVVTPTATAGALGTVFTITVDRHGGGSLLVTQSKVRYSTVEKTDIVTAGSAVVVIPDCGNRSYNGNDNGLGDGSCSSSN